MAIPLDMALHIAWSGLFVGLALGYLFGRIAKK